jgi:hypothetical protein
MGIRANTLEAGIVELATNAETVTGTDSTRAVTPAGVAAAFATPPSMGAITATELNVATGTITTSNPVLDGTQTWNDGGVTFTAHKTNITDTASASGSLLADLQVGGSSKANIRKDGALALAGKVRTYNNAAPTDGQLLIGDTAGGVFSAATLTGTANQVTVTNGAGSITLATPQSIHTAGTPQFARMGLGGAADATHLWTITGGTVTADTHLVDAAQTWNSGGVTFTAFKLNVTDTASASGSLLEDLQVGGSSKFKVSKAGNVTIAGDIDHDGSNVGFYGVTPAARPSALTQTYSTASATHSNPTATALTHTAVAGTTDGTLVDCTGTYSEAAVEENFKELAVAINNLITDVANVKQFLNQVVDQLQTLGLLQ